MNLPQPDELSTKDKDDAMGAYLMMFAAWGVGLPLPILNLVAAVIYHFVNHKNSRFAAFHSLQSLLSQVPVTPVNLVLMVWLVRNIVTGEGGFGSYFFAYLAFMVALNIAYISFSIVGMVRARNGRLYYMPFFGRIAFERYFGNNAISFDSSVPPNTPPEGF